MILNLRGLNTLLEYHHFKNEFVPTVVTMVKAGICCGFDRFFLLGRSKFFCFPNALAICHGIFYSYLHGNDNDHCPINVLDTTIRCSIAYAEKSKSCITIPGF